MTSRKYTLYIILFVLLLSSFLIIMHQYYQRKHFVENNKRLLNLIRNFYFSKDDEYIGSILNPELFEYVEITESASPVPVYSTENAIDFFNKLEQRLFKLGSIERYFIERIFFRRVDVSRIREECFVDLECQYENGILKESFHIKLFSSGELYISYYEMTFPMEMH